MCTLIVEKDLLFCITNNEISVQEIFVYSVGKNDRYSMPLSRFCDKPCLMHWKMAKHVLRYLKGTIEYSIKYTKEKDILECRF